MGKSSLANTLIGYDNLASLTDKKVRKRLPFKIGHGLRLEISLKHSCAAEVEVTHSRDVEWSNLKA